MSLDTSDVPSELPLDIPLVTVGPFYDSSEVPLNVSICVGRRGRVLLSPGIDVSAYQTEEDQRDTLWRR